MPCGVAEGIPDRREVSVDAFNSGRTSLLRFLIATVRRISQISINLPKPHSHLPCLSAVGVAHPDPRISHLLVVYLRIVNQNVEAEPRHREAADGRKQGVRGHHAIVLLLTVAVAAVSAREHARALISRISCAVKLENDDQISSAQIANVGSIKSYPLLKLPRGVRMRS